MVDKTSFYVAKNVPCQWWIKATRYSEIVVNRPAGLKSQWYLNTLDLKKYTSFDLCKAWNSTGEFRIFPCVVWSDDLRVRFFPFWWYRQNLIADSTRVEKFVSQVVTWPAATRVPILTTREAEEWDPGNEVESTHDNKIQTRPPLWEVLPLRHPCSTNLDPPPPHPQKRT